jgi:hypothetical protein
MLHAQSLGDEGKAPNRSGEQKKKVVIQGRAHAPLWIELKKSATGKRDSFWISEASVATLL